MKMETKEIIHVTTAGGSVIICGKGLDVQPLIVITETGKIVRTSTVTHLSSSNGNLLLNITGSDQWTKAVEVFTEGEFCDMFEQTMAPSELHVIDRKLGASHIAETLCCIMSKEDVLEVTDTLRLKILGDRD